MAAKILANLLVAGGTVLFRAASQAYKQAIINGTRSGMSAESVSAATKAGKQLSLQEAQMILGIEANATWEEIAEKYRKLYESNEKNGSFYLLSKVYRARERLEQEFIESGKPMPEPQEASGPSQEAETKEGTP